MTEDEGIKLHEIGNEFWIEFSKLVAKFVSQMPKHLEDETLCYLGDKTSVYGCCYEKFLPKAPTGADKAEG